MRPVSAGAEPDLAFDSSPENEVPVIVALDVVAVRTADVSMTFTHARVFSTGWELRLSGRTRPGSGRSFWDEVGPAEALRLGIGYADGRKGVSSGVRPDDSVGDEDILIGEEEGGQADMWVECGWWITPLPVPGPVTLVLYAPQVADGEVVVHVDAAAVLDAAPTVTRLWPWEPPLDDDLGLPPDDYPPGGWFRRFLDERAER